MARTDLRCDQPRAEIMLAGSSEGKCGKLLARSPKLGELVQFSNPEERTGSVFVVDHDRHLACFYVEKIDGIEQPQPHAVETVAWTALRPCNGEPVR